MRKGELRTLVVGSGVGRRGRDWWGRRRGELVIHGDGQCEQGKSVAGECEQEEIDLTHGKARGEHMGLTSAAQHIGLTWADIAHPLCNTWRGACFYNSWRGARSKTLQANLEKSVYPHIAGTYWLGESGAMGIN